MLVCTQPQKTINLPKNTTPCDFIRNLGDFLSARGDFLLFSVLLVKTFSKIVRTKHEKLIYFLRFFCTRNNRNFFSGTRIALSIYIERAIRVPEKKFLLFRVQKKRKKQINFSCLVRTIFENVLTNKTEKSKKSPRADKKSPKFLMKSQGVVFFGRLIVFWGCVQTSIIEKKFPPAE